MLLLDALEVLLQGSLDRGGKESEAILVALAAAHDDLVGAEIHVLGAQAAALEHAQPRSIEEAGHESGHTLEALQEHSGFVASQHHGQAWRALGAYDVVEPGKIDLQNFAIEEQECAQRLVLGGSGHAAPHSEIGQEGRDLGAPHVGRMALVVEEDVALDPRHVGFFRPGAGVTEPQGLSDSIEQAGLRGLVGLAQAGQGAGCGALPE
jgi:hypothetical protein